MCLALLATKNERHHSPAQRDAVMIAKAFKTTVLSLSLALLLALASVASASTDFVNITETPTDARKIDAKLVINAPPSSVWETLTDYNAFQSFVPGYKKSKVVSDKGASKVVDIQFKAAPLLPSYTYQVSVQENRSQWKMAIHRLSGDLKLLMGNYQLKPIENGTKTLLVHNLNIDTGADLPGTSAVLKSSSEKALLAVKTKSERNYQRSLISRND